RDAGVGGVWDQVFRVLVHHVHAEQSVRGGARADGRDRVVQLIGARRIAREVDGAGFQGGVHVQSLGLGDIRQLELPAVGIDVVGERIDRGRAAGDDAGEAGGGDRLEVAVGYRLDFEDALAGLTVLVAE